MTAFLKRAATRRGPHSIGAALLLYIAWQVNELDKRVVVLEVRQSLAQQTNSPLPLVDARRR
jgi:hypothetical protein